MYGRLIRVVFVSAFVAVGVAGVRSDSVTLNSGKVLEGKILKESDKAVQISAGGVVLTIPRSKIASLNKADAITTRAAALQRLEKLEVEGKWPDLYETATALLRADPKHKDAAAKQKLAAAKIREELGGKKVDELVRRRKFKEAIALLTEQFRKSGLASRGAGAVGKRALAELYLASAEARMRTSADGHAPLAEVRKARGLDPTAPGLDYVEGLAQIKLHNFKRAAGLLEKAARADPDDFMIRLQLMRCYRQTGDFLKTVLTFESAPDEAGASARRWPEVGSMLAEAYEKVALQLAAQGAKAQAAAAYEKYLNFGNPTPENLRDAIAFFKRVGDREREQAVRTGQLPKPKEEEPPSLPDMPR